MLERGSEMIMDLYKFCRLAYSLHFTLQFGNFSILSEGPQQRDPLGGLLFCLAIHPILRSTDSPLTMGFINDVSLGTIVRRNLRR